MKALLAGWVAGYAVSIIMTFVVLLSLPGATSGAGRARRLLPGSLSPWAVAVVVSVGGLLAWTLAGLVLGAAYQAVSHDAAGGFGSPNQAFTLAVSGSVAVGGIVVSLVARWARWQALATALVAAGAFGWLLPNLAER